MVPLLSQNCTKITIKRKRIIEIIGKLDELPTNISILGEYVFKIGKEIFSVQRLALYLTNPNYRAFLITITQ